ncbi:hypothetical protein ASD60_23290 [Pseudomonas sp. Root562]|nr:hypothetical protein ASD60_23290 [Pseudomonas sp. Root562]
MPRLLQRRAVQSELGKSLRARRVVVTDQLAALVALSKFIAIVGVGQALDGSADRSPGLLINCSRSLLFVELVLPMAAAPVPPLQHLPCLTR